MPCQPGGDLPARLAPHRHYLGLVRLPPAPASSYNPFYGPWNCSHHFRAPARMADLAYQRVIVKLGTSTLTGGTARLAPARIVELVRQMAQLAEAGCEVLLVSSGAIAAGR